MARRSLAASLALALALFLVSPAAADWFAPGSPLSTDLNVSAIVGAVPDPTGGMIVVFYVNVGAGVGISAQRVDRQGFHQWGPTGVVVLAPTPDLASASVVPDGSGGAIVSWRIRSGASSHRPYAQKLNAIGTLAWSPGGLLLRETWDTTGGLEVVATEDGMSGAIFAITTRVIDGGDIVAQHVDNWGGVMWGPDGRTICDATGTQQFPVITLADPGAAIIAWQDGRTAPSIQIFAQRVSDPGVSWAEDGVSFCNVNGTRSPAGIVSDGGTGCIVAWGDTRTGASGLYGQRITSGGTAQWTANGVRLSIGSAGFPKLIPDQLAGAFIVWQTAAPDEDIVAQHVESNGNLPWTLSGVLICDDTGVTSRPVIALDIYLGELYLMWEDRRSGSTSSTLYAQRIDSFLGMRRWPANGRPVTDGSRDSHTPWLISPFTGGALFCYNASGFPPAVRAFADRLFERGLTGPFAPRTAVVTDLPDDEGGWVRITLDTPWADPSVYLHTVTGYNLWRLIPDPGVTNAPMDRNAVAVAVARSERERAVITTLGDGEFPEGTWESLGFHMAVQSGQYAFVAPTRRDSSVEPIPTESFVISVHTPTPGLYLVGDPCVGHSVDNLAPAQPAPFTATVSGSGTTLETTLSWGANDENDFLEYRLYRGTSPNFVPGPGNLHLVQTGTGYSDIGAYDFCYKLAAVDRHGNLSPYASVCATPVAGVEPVVYELRLDAPRPQPMRDRGEFHFAMPSEGEVSLRIFDLAGRCVRRLAEGRMPAGEHSADWNGQDGDGRRLPAGVYHLLLETAAGRRTVRIVLAR